MRICGLQKVTLLDFPGHVACTVFLGGCNFNCPFCYNASLIGSVDAEELMSSDEFFKYHSHQHIDRTEGKQRQRVDVTVVGEQIDAVAA